MNERPQLRNEIIKLKSELKRKELIYQVDIDKLWEVLRDIKSKDKNYYYSFSENTISHKIRLFKNYSVPSMMESPGETIYIFDLDKPFEELYKELIIISKKEKNMIITKLRG